MSSTSATSCDLMARPRGEKGTSSDSEKPEADGMIAGQHPAYRSCRRVCEGTISKERKRERACGMGEKKRWRRTPWTQPEQSRPHKRTAKKTWMRRISTARTSGLCWEVRVEESSARAHALTHKHITHKHTRAQEKRNKNTSSQAHKKNRGRRSLRIDHITGTDASLNQQVDALLETLAHRVCHHSRER